MLTLKEFYNMTKDLPDDTKIEVESIVTAEKSYSSPALNNVIRDHARGTVVIRPEAISITRGKKTLQAMHSKGKKTTK